MARVYNFSAGPSMLPEKVLRQAQAELLEYGDSGQSVMEMSHRSKWFDAIIQDTEATLRRVMNIPDNYKVGFFQGGATQQFAMVPLNFMITGKADYIVTGNFSNLAAKEAAKFGEANIVASSKDKNFTYIPDVNAIPYNQDASYIHICQNNTIFGTQYVEVPQVEGVPLVADMSSMILSKPVDVTKYGCIYFGNQRYFPILDTNGKLLPKFVVVRNGVETSDFVRKGNEKVLSARLADARFFYQEDLKHPLADNVEKLKTVVFQKDLGTIYQKIERSKELASYLIDVLGCTDRRDDVLRTVYLAKADLVSNMIGEKEFTKLQGFMGADYALKSGENERVSLGIKEHYYPRFQGDLLPTEMEGIIAGIADRVDTLVGCFGVGVIPSGSKDPFALRRAALGIVNIIVNSKLNISLKALVNKSLDTLVADGVLKRDRATVEAEVLEFFKQRAINIFEDMGR